MTNTDIPVESSPEESGGENEDGPESDKDEMRSPRKPINEPDLAKSNIKPGMSSITCPNYSLVLSH